MANNAGVDIVSAIGKWYIFEQLLWFTIFQIEVCALFMLFSANYLHLCSKKLAKAYVNWLFCCHFNPIVLQCAVWCGPFQILYISAYLKHGCPLRLKNVVNFKLMLYMHKIIDQTLTKLHVSKKILACCNILIYLYTLLFLSIDLLLSDFLVYWNIDIVILIFL